MGWTAAAVAAAAVVGAASTNNAADKAAKAQTQAAQTATNAQMQMFNTTQNNLHPYMQSGNIASNKLIDAYNNNGGMNTLLQQTPGYQFDLNQGLKAVQNTASARGLGISGAAQKGAAGFATGLAQGTYQDQFNNLLKIAGLGENAAAGVGNNAVSTGSNIGSNIVGAANAQGAADLQGGKAITNAANTIGGAAIYNNNQNNSSGNGLYSATSNNAFNPQAYENGLPWSDVNLKENIVPIGEENGYPIYSFNYKGSPEKYIGVMAQDILNITPEAVYLQGTYYAVDYNKLGIEFRRVN